MFVGEGKERRDGNCMSVVRVKVCGLFIYMEENVKQAHDALLRKVC